MFNSLDVDIVGNLLVFISLLIIFIAIASLVYRRTNPPVSTGLRRFLLILRTLALVMIILILFEPLIGITWNRIQNSIIAVLVDTSASMSLTDAKVPRQQEAIRVLKQPLFQQKKKNLLFEYFQFSDNIKSIDPAGIDSLTFQGDGTDLSFALQALKERMTDKYLSSIILLTDGNYNIGENPVHLTEEFDIPIFPISIGDPNEQTDVVVSKVTTNQITYVDHQVPVDVTVRAMGYRGRKVTINLKKDNTILDSKIVELTDDALETKARMHYTPQTSGDQKYTVQIPSLENELTPLNNSKNFYVKVLKSKMKLLFIAGSPSFDFSFIKGALAEDPNVEISYWVLKNERQFYEGNFPTSKESLKIYDCIILLDFPRRNSPPSVINTLKELLETEDKPLLIINSKDLHFSALRPIQNYLPINLQISTTVEQLVGFNLTPEGLTYPVMRLSDNDIENQNRWRDLPPIYYSFRNVNMTPGSVSLLDVEAQQSRYRDARKELPLIVVRKVNQQKSMMILGYGLWRWDFLMTGVGKSNEIFKQFLGNCIRWLITREDSKLVRIVPDKEIYRSGEKVSFTAETYYEDYRPLEDAEVKVMVKSKSKEHELLLSRIGEGKYEGEIQVLEGGDYTYAGQAFYEDRLLGEDSGRFSVEEFSIEFIDTRMNETLLQQMASKSNGKYFTAHNFSGLEQELNFPNRKIAESRQWEIWNKLSLLIAVILLLSTEWFIRKKKGML